MLFCADRVAQEINCFLVHTISDTHRPIHTHTANSQWLMVAAKPLSALNNIEAQVLRNAGDSEECQMELTLAYSTVQMLQMSTKTDNMKTKKPHQMAT